VLIWKIPAEFSHRFVLGMVRALTRNGSYTTTLPASITDNKIDIKHGDIQKNLIITAKIVKLWIQL
jgi:hypothetical protein